MIAEDDDDDEVDDENVAEDGEMVRLDFLFAPIDVVVVAAPFASFFLVVFVDIIPCLSFCFLNLSHAVFSKALAG